MTFSISKTPNCVQDPTFTLASTPTAVFASRTVNANGESGYVRLTGATLANIGTYSMTLTAIVDAQTTTNAFTMIIMDPCKRAIFETTPAPILMMTITMPSSGPTTQTVKIYTDVERATSPAVICPITGVLSPSTKPWISFTNPTITINHGAITLPTDIGQHTFTFTVDS
jgi:hypothetical protein